MKKQTNSHCVFHSSHEAFFSRLFTPLDNLARQSQTLQKINVQMDYVLFMLNAKHSSRNKVVDSIKKFCFARAPLSRIFVFNMTRDSETEINNISAERGKSLMPRKIYIFEQTFFLFLSSARCNQSPRRLRRDLMNFCPSLLLG